MKETTVKDWNIEAMTGYKPKTTFYMDFSIADKFGKDAIIDTFNRAFKSWEHNVEYITELEMVMGWKSFEHEGDGLCEVYSDFYYKLRDWVFEESGWDKDQMSYYLKTTD